VRLNTAGAVLSLVLGLLVVLSAARGAALHPRLSPVLGWGIIGIAMVELALLQTSANVLDASMSNVVVWTLLGLVVLTAGLYGQAGTRDEQRAEEKLVHPRGDAGR
jgi:peptidoglycan/LPS O-acetylase OafA/YrhL